MPNKFIGFRFKVYLCIKGAMHKFRAVTFKPRVTPVIIGTEFINGGIKTLGVVHFKPVAQFVYYHAVDDLGRREHKQTVKVQISFCRTAAPARFLRPYRDLSVIRADYVGVIFDTFGDVFDCLVGKLFYVIDCDL